MKRLSTFNNRKQWVSSQGLIALFQKKTIIPLLFLIGLFLSSCQNKYDELFHYDLTLQSNKKTYFVGEEIIMTATIKPKELDTVRLYKDRSKSFKVLVRSSEEGPVESENQEQIGCKRTINNPGIDSIQISPASPFFMKIVGRIEKNKRGGVLFDFGDFGCFSAESFGDFYIWGHWEPVDPHWSDALEDYTNNVKLNIKSSETQN